jgi:transcriptional regulator with XRE-family HTH domain
VTAPYWSDDLVTLHLGKAERVLPTLTDASADAICTDPPYELGFMGRSWDASGIAYDAAMWAECLRVLKPGGHLLAFGGTRTYHRMVCAVEDAGFEIRDSIHWIYGSGFPKGIDVGKAIDHAGGASPAEQARTLRAARERAEFTRQQVADAVGCTLSSIRDWEDGRARSAGRDVEHIVPSPQYRAKLADLLGYSADERTIAGLQDNAIRDVYRGGGWRVCYGAASTDLARTWSGWNTALKPAHEPIVLARKPLAGTVAANVLEYGTGALNIAGCRIPTNDDLNGGAYYGDQSRDTSHGWRMNNGAGDYQQPVGRWPTNVVFSHLPECGPDDTTPCVEGCAVAELNRQSGVLTSGANPARRGSDKFRDTYGEFTGQQECAPARGADSGGASRFFPVFRYEAKAPTAERPRVNGVAHETVKPLALMRWLVRLITPPGGVILDPFLGSGTTAEACVIEGFRCVGIEHRERYVPLIKARLSKPLQPTLGFEEEGV